MSEGPGTILGGLPVIAVVTGGKDPDTPNGPGEYWSGVVSIHWMRRDGSKGKEIPEHVRDRAEKYDYQFCDLTEQVCDHIAQEQWAEEHAASASDTRPKGGDNLLAPFTSSAMPKAGAHN